MKLSLFHILAATAILTAGSALQAQQASAPAANPSTAAAAAPAAAPAPAVGDVAPDFTAPAADQNGARTVSLSHEQGHVVVLAFYPKDRSSGCTAELTKFRDEFHQIFGDNVVVLPVSTDSNDSHVGWAKDARFPFPLVSDPDGQIATKYGSLMPGRSMASRTVFVIGPDGHVAYTDMKFGALDQHAYDALTAAIKQVRGH